MKTKKISWQAIAIVVLALVLIASIALGVSGAWFQDRDAAGTDTTLGQAVTIRLVDGTNGGAVQKWDNTYNSAVTKAYPGDKLLDSVKIAAGNTETYAIYRASITPTVKEKVAQGTSGATNVEGKDYALLPVTFDPEHKITLEAIGGTTAPAKVSDDLNAYYTALIGLKKNRSDFADGVVGDQAYATANNAYTTKARQWNLWLLENMVDQLANAEWTKGTDGKVYYKEVTNNPEIALIKTSLKLSEYLTNEVELWEIGVSIDVEAIQAANILSNADWADKMPDTLKGTESDTWTTAEENHCQTVYAYNTYRAHA